jgi:hypothetical protein
MARSLIRAAAISVALILPASVMAQGVVGGMEHGAREGDRAAGPVVPWSVGPSGPLLAV